MSTRFGPSEGKCEVCQSSTGYDIEVLSNNRQIIRVNACDKCRKWLAEELLGRRIK